MDDMGDLVFKIIRRSCEIILNVQSTSLMSFRAWKDVGEVYREGLGSASTGSRKW